ncbi:RnfABCDGE type electron transport complex subunit D [Thermatribacter velox]|uniref:Ion-translocating oxidoreductase complex subunit D n=1 Tax=Thermatribacter velox TaxID=3039681 RepID=A0ABZ2YE50_9BACT
MSEALRLVFTPSPHIKDATTVPWIMKQVFLALLPAAIWGIYFFGPAYAFWPLLLSILSCVGFEALDCWLFKRPLSIFDGSALVTGMLLGLSLPPGCPFWIPIVGGGAAILLGKQVFGGLGQNIFNPALVGRAVLLVSWPQAMTTWVAKTPFAFPNLEQGAMNLASGVDVVTTPTPLGISKMFGYSTLKQLDPHILWRLFVGLVPGSIGEISALLLLAGFFYLLWRGIVSWDIPVFFFVGLTLVAFLGGENPLYHLLAGGAVMGACFKATDYVTTPMTQNMRYLFGFGAGAITALIRIAGGYPEGVTFGILAMNALVPLMDRHQPRRFGVKPR